MIVQYHSDHKNKQLWLYSNTPITVLLWLYTIGEGEKQHKKTTMQQTNHDKKQTTTNQTTMQGAKEFFGGRSIAIENQWSWAAPGTDYPLDANSR